MSLPLFLQGLGSVGVFASRAFLPAFATALLLRFGPQFPWLARGLLPHVTGVPTWFTSDAALAVFGLLAALELAAERFPEAQPFLDQVHDGLKAGMAVLTYLGVLGATDRGAVEPLMRQAGLFDMLPALAIGAGTFAASRARGALLSPLTEADEDDDLRVQGLLRGAGDLWGVLGPVALIVLPVLTLAAFGATVVALILLERRVAAWGERSQVPCLQCGQPLHASAPSCPNCHAPVPAPRDVGLLGRPRARPANPATLPYQLVAVKRCPACASRLSRKAARQTCGACGHVLMGDPGFARAYVAFVDRRVPLTCAVAFAFGLVPVLGVIPAVIYQRLTVIAPYRRYVPAGRGLLLRWGLRVATLLLVAFQWVPVAGAFALPVLTMISYAAYRSTFRALALAPIDGPPAAPG